MTWSADGPAFEDYAVGQQVRTAGRTIEMSDILTFAGLTGDHYPLHTDEEYAAQTQFGTRIAHGPLTFAMAIGLIALSNFYGDCIVAMKECQQLRARLPVFPGDTIHVEASVAAVEPSRRPDAGVLTMHYSVVNQKAEEVMTFRMVLLARRRTGGDET
jgi:3-hydroxybutyryl-CoA dehydratase